MPNYYEEQARQRFHRAKAFVDKAHGLMLQEDLVSRSALDDAISAIKNSLQGYLMYQIAQSSGSRAQNDWPEVAAGNRMPDLIRACQQAGLPLNGLDGEIKKLNDERNFRTHDDPLRAVDTVQARQAVEVALMVQRRIAEALKRSGVSGILTGRPAVSEEATMPKTGAGRAPVAGRAASASPAAVLSRSTTSVIDAPNATSGSNGHTPAPASAPSSDEDDEEPPAMRAAEQSWARRRAVSLLTRIVVALALIVAGAIAGVAYSAYAGLTPHGLLGAESGQAANAQPSATPTLLPAGAAFSAGDLLVGAPVCQSGRSAISLRNLGSTPLTFSLGSPDAGDATFAPTPDGQGQATLTGTVAPSATLAVYAQATAARYHIVVVGQSGTIQLLAGAC
ncbi:MAG TPA: hypothetical protein VHR15_11975 [Ktedonobacterales bacterium]|nr:hypothetical protein [Ktedonobacterales bacterium]